jgi:PTH1 family peptidyl-tRNA hydrolase
MKLVLGLGNPGKSYAWTRHNLGYLTVDFYAKLNGLIWASQEKFNADVIKYDDLILAKSHTFYNEVGLTARKLIDFYKLDPATDLLVVCDDLTRDFGKLRYRERGSAGGNNGLKSLITHLGTSDFQRLRLGTDNPTRATLGDTDFVLSRFTPEEKQQLPEIMVAATAKIDAFLA